MGSNVDYELSKIAPFKICQNCLVGFGVRQPMMKYFPFGQPSRDKILMSVAFIYDMNEKKNWIRWI